MRDCQTMTQLLQALKDGHRLEAHPDSHYAGEQVEYLPTVDEANGHPDFYCWHVVGRSDDHRLSCTKVVVID